MARIAIFLLLIFPTLAVAATEWTYGSSDHFEIYTTGGPGKAREALNYFERIHAFYSEVLKVDPQGKAPTRLIVFSNVKEYTPYRPNEGAFAFYQPGPDRDYIVMQSLGEQVYPVVVHEYMHLVEKHLNAATLPIWLNEGWADFYSTVEPKAGKMSVGGIPPGRLYQATMSKPMPLEKLFAVGHNSAEYNDKKLMGEFYSQSWALVHMLLASDDYYAQSPKFLQAMLNGADSAKAITETYGRSLAQVAKDLDGYLRVGQYKLRLFDYKSPKPLKDLETRAATAFEANLVTANLQAAGMRGETEARAAFAQLEKEDATHLELQESIAYFEYRRGHREAAVPHFARAAELNSKNWQLYRDYAFAISDPDLRTELLGKAAALNPGDIDTRLRYADGLLRAGKQAQALAALMPVASIKKENAFQFFQLSALANIANQRMDEAKKAAERAVEFASTPVESDYARRLLASLSRPAADQAAMAAEPVFDDVNGATADDSPTARPTLVRREQSIENGGRTVEQMRAFNQASQVNNSEVVMDATFQQLDCTGPQPVMQFGLGTNNATLRLSMNSPDSILLRGAGTATINLNCGGQNNRAVRVGYNKLDDATKHTTGDVRFLELK